MNIPLSGFDEHIDDAIVKRGLAYFRKGRVLSFTESGPGEYEAVVGGTEDYTVRLTVRNGMLTDHRCDCPFDMGPFCKHEVAALFYRQQEELGLSVKPPSSKKPKAAPVLKTKPRTMEKRLSDLLGKASPEELRVFLREQAEGNTSFRKLLLSSFAQYDEDESKTEYAKQIKGILRSARDRQGFVNWSAASHVGRAVGELLSQAQNRLEAGNWKSAFFIATAVMEQMVDALQYADDSNGDIGSCITLSCELLYELARRQNSEEQRRMLFDYCLSAFDKEIYSGWNWEVDMLRIALLLVDGKNDAKQLGLRIELLHGSDFIIEVAQKLRYELIAKIDGDEAADKYVEAHLACPSMRRVAIAKAFGREQYEKAREMAQNGVEIDRDSKPGYAIEWTEWLLKIAQATDDREQIVSHARFLLIENFNPNRTITRS